MTEQNEGPVTAAATLVRAPNQDLTPVARELDGQVAVLTMQYRPHNLIGIALFDALIDGMHPPLVAAEDVEGAHALADRYAELSSGAPFSHPHWWAAFQTVGGPAW